MPSTPENWAAIKALFEAALGQDHARRSSFLEEQCPDASVRAEVERLLVEHGQASAFLSAPFLHDLSGNTEASTRILRKIEFLAGRFRIVRFIASGGMGEVYEAEDQELRERVAIKIIRPAILNQPNAVARFKREVHLARKVTHPNVCRVFDLFRHRSEVSGTSEEIVFISMELLRGQTLASHLKESGKMSELDALPLVCQMASALSAAQAVGIVHRDFKPGNVVLVRSPGQESVRSVVTDFGLAVQSLVSDEGVSVSSGQGILGTPAYMAPEQLEGRPATAASDIYAFGLVIYEMVAGVQPFQGDTPMSAALKRLSEAPAPPRKFQPGLSPAWETAILRCLERNPAKRFANAEDIVRAVSSDSTTIASGTPRRKGVALLVGAALALLLLSSIGIGYGLRRVKMRAQPIPYPSFHPRRSVAVLGFKNLSEKQDEAWLSTALSEMTTSELAAGGELRAIPGETVSQMKTSLDLSNANTYGASTLQKIRRNVGCDDIVVGAYLALGNGRVRVDLNLEDASSGELVDSITEDGEEDRIDDLVARAGASLRARLGAGEVSPAEAAQVKATLPTNPEAARLYAEGLDKLRHFDPLSAQDLLKRATLVQPGFALAHANLAMAFSQLDNDREAGEESKKAVDLSSTLSRSDQLSVSGMAAEAAGNWSKAIEVFRTLWNFFPDDDGYARALAVAQLTAGKGHDALSTVEALRKHTSHQGDDPQIDIIEAYADESLSDFKKELAAAEQAQDKANRDGSRLTVAAACMPEGWALLSLGQISQAVAVFQQAQRIYEATGNRDGAARALGNIAYARFLQGDLAGALGADKQALGFFRETASKRNLAATLGNMAMVLDQQGNISDARKARQQSLAIDREIGNKHGIQSQLNGLAELSKEQGNLDQARQEYEESLAVSREIGYQQGIGITLGNLGNLFLKQGMVRKAQPLYEQALQVRTAIGDKHGISIESNNLASLYLDEGDLVRAGEMEDQALAVGREIGEKNLIADALGHLGDIRLQQGNFAAARKSYSEAFSIWNEMGYKRNLSAVRGSLADLSIEEGHLQDAATSLRTLRDEFSKQKDSESQVAAETSLARALLEEEHPTDAEKEIHAAQRLLPGIRDFDILHAFEIVAARVQFALGNSAAAKKKLEGALSESIKAGFVPYQFEARLALGEIEIKSNQSAAGRAHLEQLRKDAASKGFLLIVHKAAAAAAERR